ncbi:MAG TPA: LysR family transcriptional regulator [Verrucomicrobiales bacterium]|jgi:DNA-binding transcriptional LysR family regulator|nr:LysR family transcriptional regulator [Verrucomicrobiales bacterium]
MSSFAQAGYPEPFDSRQLRALCVLGVTGSFTETARRLNLTQSAISHSIKALETETGLPLIERSGRRALLTQAGQSLTRRAERILREMSGARGELEQLLRWGGSRLRVGASPTACQYLLPAVIREFGTQFPRWKIEIISSDTRTALEGVLDGQLDLALCMKNPGSGADTEFRELFSEEIRLAIPAGHAWEGRKIIPADEIVTERLISYTGASFLPHLIKAHLAKEGVRLPDPAVALGSLEAIKEMIKLGMGVAFIPSWVATREVAAGTLHLLTVRPGKLLRRWGVAWRRKRPLSHGEETFIKLSAFYGTELTTGDSKLLTLKEAPPIDSAA